ncbi:MAG: hypothetical protein H6711_30220 [Myxococcales bacterium]|nr:hypothetical protein [Myxococcales bacterium]
MESDSVTARRFRFTIVKPSTASGSVLVAFDLPGLDAGRLAEVRALLEPGLGAGFVAQVDGEVVARGPALHDRDALLAPFDLVFEQTRRLTELAVQQHEYCYAELQRLRRDYEEDFSEERSLLRELRQRWLARVCDDSAKSEDVARYLAAVAEKWIDREDLARAAAKPRSAETKDAKGG